MEAVDLVEQLAEWQQYHHWDRPRSTHNGKSSIDKYFELSNETPLWKDIQKFNFSDSDRIQNQNYKVDLEVQRLKRSL